MKRRHWLGRKSRPPPRAVCPSSRSSLPSGCSGATSGPRTEDAQQNAHQRSHAAPNTARTGLCRTQPCPTRDQGHAAPCAPNTTARPVQRGTTATPVMGRKQQFSSAGDSPMLSTRTAADCTQFLSLHGPPPKPYTCSPNKKGLFCYHIQDGENSDFSKSHQILLSN